MVKTENLEMKIKNQFVNKFTSSRNSPFTYEGKNGIDYNCKIFIIFHFKVYRDEETNQAFNKAKKYSNSGDKNSINCVRPPLLLLLLLLLVPA